MLIFLDMCCLKRPFDDQSQLRKRLESDAVLRLLAAEGKDVRFVRSPSLILQNYKDLFSTSAARIEEWLAADPDTRLDVQPLMNRASELMNLGFKDINALHLASAEFAKADVLATCNDRFLARANRHRDVLRVRVMPIVELAEEVLCEHTAHDTR